MHMGPVVPEERRAQGLELEFIVRSLVEVKLQLEELRRRVDDDRAVLEQVGRYQLAGEGLIGGAGAIEPLGAVNPNVVTVTPGMTMAEIEKQVIVAALRETRGNRRKAAEILDIGERTLYRKLKEYELAGHPAG